MYTIELLEPLARDAEQRLKTLRYDNVTVRSGDGYAGWPERAPFDVILVTAAPDHVPSPLVSQLAAGGRLVYGGRRLRDGDFAHGHYVEPTVIDDVRADCSLLQEELFVPLTVVCEVTSLDEAIERANSTEYGLTAGLYSEDEREVERFYNNVHAGVLYVNRKAGATTGAWPGVNPFGGWKASGLTGRGSGGPYYVQQFMREQSRVRVR